MFVGRRVYTCNTSLKPGSTKSILRITLLLRIPIPHRQIRPVCHNHRRGGSTAKIRASEARYTFKSEQHTRLYPFDCPPPSPFLHTLHHPVSFYFTIQSFSEQLDSIARGKKALKARVALSRRVQLLKSVSLFFLDYR